MDLPRLLAKLACEAAGPSALETPITAGGWSRVSGIRSSLTFAPQQIDRLIAHASGDRWALWRARDHVTAFARDPMAAHRATRLLEEPFWRAKNQL